METSKQNYLDFISKAHVMNIQSPDKSKTLLEMVTGHHQFEIVELLLKREKSGTTLIAVGIALAHVQTKWVKEPKLAFGLLKKKIEWELNEKVKLIVLLLIPPNPKTSAIDAIKSLMKDLANEELTDLLIEMADARDIKNQIMNWRK